MVQLQILITYKRLNFNNNINTHKHNKKKRSKRLLFYKTVLLRTIQRSLLFYLNIKSQEIIRVLPFYIYPVKVNLLLLEDVYLLFNLFLSKSAHCCFKASRTLLLVQVYAFTSVANADMLSFNHSVENRLIAPRGIFYVIIKTQPFISN